MATKVKRYYVISNLIVIARQQNTAKIRNFEKIMSLHSTSLHKNETEQLWNDIPEINSVFNTRYNHEVLQWFLLNCSKSSAT